MALNDTERELFENLYFEESAPIRQKLDADLKRLDSLDDVNKHADYFKVLKESAGEDIDVRVSTYIETHKRGGKYPDEADPRF